MIVVLNILAFARFIIAAGMSLVAAVFAAGDVGALDRQYVAVWMLIAALFLAVDGVRSVVIPPAPPPQKGLSDE
jgi:hypothetical protein